MAILSCYWLSFLVVVALYHSQPRVGADSAATATYRQLNQLLFLTGSPSQQKVDGVTAHHQSMDGGARLIQLADTPVRNSRQVPGEEPDIPNTPYGANTMTNPTSPDNESKNTSPDNESTNTTSPGNESTNTSPDNESTNTTSPGNESIPGNESNTTNSTMVSDPGEESIPGVDTLENIDHAMNKEERRVLPVEGRAAHRGARERSRQVTGRGDVDPVQALAEMVEDAKVGLMSQSSDNKDAKVGLMTESSNKDAGKVKRLEGGHVETSDKGADKGAEKGAAKQSKLHGFYYPSAGGGGGGYGGGGYGGGGYGGGGGNGNGGGGYGGGGGNGGGGYGDGGNGGGGGYGGGGNGGGGYGGGGNGGGGGGTDSSTHLSNSIMTLADKVLAARREIDFWTRYAKKMKSELKMQMKLESGGGEDHTVHQHHIYSKHTSGHAPVSTDTYQPDYGDYMSQGDYTSY